MKPQTIPLLDLAANGEAPSGAATSGVPSRDGFFWCGHCNRVIDSLSQREIDAAENAPAGTLMQLKCPGCHKHEVVWRVPTPARAIGPDNRPVRPPPQPVSRERAQELWAQLHQQLHIA